MGTPTGQLCHLQPQLCSYCSSYMQLASKTVGNNCWKRSLCAATGCVGEAEHNQLFSTYCPELYVYEHMSEPVSFHLWNRTHNTGYWLWLGTMRTQVDFVDSLHRTISHTSILSIIESSQKQPWTYKCPNCSTHHPLLGCLFLFGPGVTMWLPETMCIFSEDKFGGEVWRILYN